MKKRHLIYAACLLVGMGACAASAQNKWRIILTYGRSTIRVLYCLRTKHRKRWDRTFTTGSFPMLNHTSRNRHVLYWLLFTTRLKIVFQLYTRYIIHWKMLTAFQPKAVVMAM